MPFTAPICQRSSRGNQLTQGASNTNQTNTSQNRTWVRERTAARLPFWHLARSGGSSARQSGRGMVHGCNWQIGQRPAFPAKAPLRQVRNRDPGNPGDLPRGIAAVNCSGELLRCQGLGATGVGVRGRTCVGGRGRLGLRGLLRFSTAFLVSPHDDGGVVRSAQRQALIRKSHAAGSCQPALARWLLPRRGVDGTCADLSACARTQPPAPVGWSVRSEFASVDCSPPAGVLGFTSPMRGLEREGLEA